MSFKPLTRSLAFGAVAMVTFACSTSNKGGAGGSPTDGGGGASTGGAAGKGGSGGASGSSGASGSGGSSKDAASCGDDALILSDYWKQQPAQCTACIHSKCCAEAEARASDTGCAGDRKCLGACSQYDAVCQSSCGAQNLPSNSDGGLHSGSVNGDFNVCRLTKCETECIDLSCVGKAWPAPATAHDITINATLTNFSGGALMPGVTIKVCAHTDTNCATPLDQGTTKSDATIQLKAPAAAGGTDAYFEFSGPTVFPEISYFHSAGAETLLAQYGFAALDPATAAVFQKLAGGMPLLDGGSDAGVPYGSVAILPRSCANSVVVGATVSSSNAGSAAVTSYLVKGIPSTTATMTDQTGIGAVVNHAVGPTTVTVKLGTQTLGTANVLVRAGVLTTVTVQPGQSGP